MTNSMQWPHRGIRQQMVLFQRRGRFLILRGHSLRRPHPRSAQISSVTMKCPSQGMERVLKWGVGCDANHDWKFHFSIYAPIIKARGKMEKQFSNFPQVIFPLRFPHCAEGKTLLGLTAWGHTPHNTFPLSYSLFLLFNFLAFYSVVPVLEHDFLAVGAGLRRLRCQPRHLR